MLLTLLVLSGLLLFGASASAAPAVAKDGKIHACYKAKGKGKGTLRLARNAKARCPKKWKKVAWYAAGPGASIGAPGATGPQGPQGERGVPGTAGNVVVEDLEKQVNELLTKVQSLEGVLQGVTNTDLKEAIAAVPVVQALCTQTEALNDQTTALGTSLSGLSTVLDTLTVLGLPSIPTALPPFECP
jgi:hypothetical protein